MNGKVVSVAAAVTLAVLGGCSSESNPTDNNTNGGDPGDLTGKLRTVDNSDTFYAELRGALIAQGETYGGQGGGRGEDLAVAESEALGAPASPQAGGSATDGDSTASQGASDSTTVAANEVTSTTVQEVGVDEQDRVKVSSDGSRLYVLQSAYPDVFPVDGPFIIEPAVGIPEPDGSSVDALSTSMPAPQNFNTTLRIMALDADTPDSRSLRELQINLEGRRADGFYLYENNGSDTALLTSTGGGYWGYWGDSIAFSGLDSVITRVDVTNPDTASVTGTFRIDGQIVSSRRIGKHLFFASRYYPSIPEAQPWSLTPEEWRATVEGTDLAGLLPQYSRDDSTTVTPLVDPAGCFVSAKPSGTPWYSPDIITLGVLDLETMQLTDSECYLGASETLYASPEAVYLATTQWDYSYGPVDASGAVVDVDDAVIGADIVWSDPRVSTDIHQFDIDNGQLLYVGSGSVRGHLGWNALRKPFRMSEKDGFLRVATFNDQQRRDMSPIYLSVLEPDGQGSLQRIAELPNAARPDHIGKPGEQLYASRFLGDRAYLVTFRQTDPLYVIDVSNPSDPLIAGELEIDGYSDFLQPIGENHLFGVGKDAVAVTGGRGDGRGALVQGVKLALFNVENPREPYEVDSVVVGQRGTESEALNNHRAITIQAATDQHPTRVSFGIDVHGRTSPGSKPQGNEASIWYPWSYTGLHGFDINIGDGAGIVSRGALVVESPGSNELQYGPVYRDDRAVMVNDSVFYVHGPEVWAARWDDLANPSVPR